MWPSWALLCRLKPDGCCWEGQLHEHCWKRIPLQIMETNPLQTAGNIAPLSFQSHSSTKAYNAAGVLLPMDGSAQELPLCCRKAQAETTSSLLPKFFLFPAQHCHCFQENLSHAIYLILCACSPFIVSKGTEFLIYTIKSNVKRREKN